MPRTGSSLALRLATLTLRLAASSLILTVLATPGPRVAAAQEVGLSDPPRMPEPASTGAGSALQEAQEAAAPIDVVEATVRELQDAMEAGEVTAVQLVDAFLARIEAYDRRGPRLNAMIRLNPEARAEAERLDEERAEEGARGPLHGIPVILKDNYDMYDMPTTGGCLALAGHVPPDDGFQVRRLREAGAVILGKANMHELASGITTIGSMGGQTRNPYDPERNPGGSSGGTGAAVAASFAVIGWGTDTCGSIRIPASQNNLFGLRPTKGLSSIDGILPLSHTQDVGGPLARTVGDLAVALDATVGPDPADPATRMLEGRELPRFVDALDPAALEGARIGVLESLFDDDSGERDVIRVLRAALERMEELGAHVVEVEIEELDSLLEGSGVINHEFKWDFIDYLGQSGAAPVDSLTEILEMGLLHEELVGRMRRRNAPESRRTEEYRAALAKRQPLREALLGALERDSLDALAYPTMRRAPSLIGEPQRGSTCFISAHSGLPALTIPAGFAGGELPVGLELLGRALDDARLVALGYAFEQGTDHRRPPPTTPALVDGRAPAPVRFTIRASGAGYDPVVENRVWSRVRLAWDRTTGELAYEIIVTGVEAPGLFAVVLRHRSETEEGGEEWSVVERIAGPGISEITGTLDVDPVMRRRLEAGELHLEVFTRDHPTGAARGRLVVPR